MTTPSSDHVPGGPRGATDVITFIAVVVFPLLSAGILCLEILRLTPDVTAGMDAVLSVGMRRGLGVSMAGLGLAASTALAFDRSGTARDRRFHRLFLAVNLAVALGWLAFWYAAL